MIKNSALPVSITEADIKQIQKKIPAVKRKTTGQ